MKNLFKRLRTKVMLLFTLFFCCSSTIFAQNTNTLNYEGTVINQNSEPLPGVSVQIVGTTKGVVTNNSGQFSIIASQGNRLSFTLLGYVRQEITLGSNQQLSITLTEGADSTLSDVVVIGYGTRRREDVTSAISTITSQDLQDAHNGATVSTRMAGKLAGVTFRQGDGRPGASAAISIRNMGPALYIIDGIQQDEGQFNNIAPNDIESITVLKDAAAAIYGVQAGNGVVLVTTKRGKLGTRSSINVDAYTGWQNWFRFPKTTNNYEWQRGRVEADVNEKRPPMTPEELEKYKQGTLPGYQSFDWYNFIVKPNAPLNNININFTGGTDKVNYYVSGTHLFQNSVLGREYWFKRTNIQSNIDAQVTKSIKIGAQINGRIETRQNPGVPEVDDYWMARLAILRNTPWERPYANDNPEYINKLPGHEATNWAYLNYKNAGLYNDTWRVLQTNFNAEYKTPIKGLTLKGLYSYYYANQILNNHEYTYKTYTFDPKDSVYNWTGGSQNPWRERVNHWNLVTNMQFTVDYARTFGKHSIGLMLANDRMKRNEIHTRVHSVPTTNDLSLITFNEMDTYEDGNFTISRIGYVGRFSYNYDNKYYLDIAGRRDASYILSPDKKWGTFPSVSAAWRFTKENWFQNLVNPNVLSEFKLRASYGSMGDDRWLADNRILDAFSYLNSYDFNWGAPVILDGKAVPVAHYRGVPINNISWIRINNLDLGLDFGLLKNKLTGTFDWFRRERSHIPGPRYDLLLPNELGYVLPQENLEERRDKVQGFEGSINYRETINELTFSIGANATWARPWDVSSYKPRFFNSWDEYRWTGEGRPQNLFWAYEVIGQFQSQDEINNYPINNDGQGNRSQLPGDFKYKDINGDGVINYFDERPIGWGENRNPIFSGGLNLSAQWKGLDFSAGFTAASGYTFNRDWELKWPFINGGGLVRMFYDDHWRHEDIYDVNSPWIPGKYPALTFNRVTNNHNKFSSFWLVNIHYIKLRNLELGYSIPQRLLDKVNISRARIYVNMSNVFSIDNVRDLGIDPEVYEKNGLQYPQSKFLNVGVNLSF